MTEHIITDEANASRIVTVCVIGFPWAIILFLFIRTTGISRMSFGDHTAGWMMIAIFSILVLSVFAFNLRQRYSAIKDDEVVVFDRWLTIIGSSKVIPKNSIADISVAIFKGGFGGRQWNLLKLSLSNGESYTLNTSSDAERVQLQKEMIEVALNLK